MSSLNHDAISECLVRVVKDPNTPDSWPIYFVVIETLGDSGALKTIVSVADDLQTATSEAELIRQHMSNALRLATRFYEDRQSDATIQRRADTRHLGLITDDALVSDAADYLSRTSLDGPPSGEPDTPET